MDFFHQNFRSKGGKSDDFHPSENRFSSDFRRKNERERERIEQKSERELRKRG